MVSDSTAKMPGASSAASPVNRHVHRDRDPERRRDREQREGAGEQDADDRQQAQPERPGPSTSIRVASGIPMRMPMHLGGLAPAAMKPRAAFVEVEHLLVVERREGERGR